MIQVQNVSLQFRQSDTLIKALDDVSLTIQDNETVAIVGPSGSGKTTLLSLMAGLENPDSGSITINGEEISRLDERRLGDFRSHNMGIVFQQFHLMPHLTAYENVSLPLEILGVRDRDEKIKKVLEMVGLSHRLHHLPSQMSGGENQRVAIARAIVHTPKILFADEPSGNLDSENGKKVMDLIFSLVESQKLSLVLITHDTDLALRCSRQISIQGGRIL